MIDTDLEELHDVLNYAPNLVRANRGPSTPSNPLDANLSLSSDSTTACMQGTNGARAAVCIVALFGHSLVSRIVVVTFLCADCACDPVVPNKIRTMACG